MNVIEINSAIFPKVLQIVLGQPQPRGAVVKSENEDFKPELIIDLPRTAYLTYLKHMASKGPSKELDLLKQYATGTAFSNNDYEEAIKLILFTGTRNNSLSTGDDFLEPFGIRICHADGKRDVAIIASEEQRLRAETWEYILIDILRESAFEIIECFDFESSFVRTESNNSISDELRYSLMAWRFSFDELEQSLSNALRTAFIFTLVGYCYGDNKNNYGSFQAYFDAEYFKRVSLIYATWINREPGKKIQYIPFYESFHNLSGNGKTELIDILKAILDDPAVALDEKNVLKARLIEGAGAVHNAASVADVLLEQSLVKPVVNFIMLREKAKETIESVKLLCAEGHYSACANRCYYAMMFSLKALLEHKGMLADWKANELKELETHGLLEKKLTDLVSQNVLSAQTQSDFDYVKDQRWKCDYSLYAFGEADALSCLQKAVSFYAIVEGLTS